MGDEARAREEYDKAMQGADNDADRLDFGLQKAMSWVRENNLAEADKAFSAVADLAHAQKLHMEEAQAHRMMGMYAGEDAAALTHLQAAEEALDHGENLAQSDREAERARILRYRATRALRAGNQDLVGQTLQQLESLAGSSRNSIIQTSYHGAAGALLVAKQKFADAIPHLEEDRDNPYSLELLSRAYAETGATDKMHEVEAVLRGTNVPTIEQALVVPAVRGKRPAFP
jgi:hypothetical protein